MCRHPSMAQFKFCARWCLPTELAPIVHYKQDVYMEYRYSCNNSVPFCLWWGKVTCLGEVWEKISLWKTLDYSRKVRRHQKIRNFSWRNWSKFSMLCCVGADWYSSLAWEMYRAYRDTKVNAGSLFSFPEKKTKRKRNENKRECWF